MDNKSDVVKFNFLLPNVQLKNRTFLKAFVVKLFKEEGFELDTVNYIFCSDEYLLDINKQYLNHDTYTDIVTFSLAEPGQPIVSDIFISVDRVADNAQQFGKSFVNELHRVVFHGALHLCGYKDKSKKDAVLMRAKEDYYLNQYFVPRETKTK